MCALFFSTKINAQIDSAIQLHLLFSASDSITPKAAKKLHPDSVIQYAFSFMGDRYKRGGTSSKGFDCSGYTLTVYKKFNIKLPHTSAGQSHVGVEIPKKLISKGDLVFFRGRNSRRKGIGHVGIVISEKNEPIEFIHSSTSGGVRIDRLESDYYKKRFIKATRVLPLHVIH